MPQQDTLSDTDLMATFVRRHGDAPGADAGEGPATQRRAPEADPSARSSLPTGSDDQGGEEEGDTLDEATLQALGLAGQDGQNGGETDGATGPSVDLGALTKALGLEPDAMTWTPNGVRFKAKVDGQSFEVSPEELRKGYQLQSHFTRQQEEFLRQQREWERAVQVREQELAQTVDMASQVLGAEEADLRNRFTRHDWEILRKEDPAEYAALVADYNQQLHALRSRQQKLVEAAGRRQQERAAESQRQMAQHMREQGAKLVETLNWKGEEQIRENGTRLNQYMLAQGFTPQDLAGVYDHRAFVLAEKARQYDELQAKISKARAKISTAPVMPSSGPSAIPTGTGKVKQRNDAMARLRKEGSLEAAADAFLALGIN